MDKKKFLNMYKKIESGNDVYLSFNKLFSTSPNYAELYLLIVREKYNGRSYVTTGKVANKMGIERSQAYQMLERLRQLSLNKTEAKIKGAHRYFITDRFMDDLLIKTAFKTVGVYEKESKA